MLYVQCNRFRVPMKEYRLTGGEPLAAGIYNAGIMKWEKVKSKIMHTDDSTVQVALSAKESTDGHYAGYIDGICARMSIDECSKWLQQEDPSMSLTSITALQMKMLEQGSRVRVFLIKSISIDPAYKEQGLEHSLLKTLPAILHDTMYFHGIVLGCVRGGCDDTIKNAKETPCTEEPLRAEYMDSTILTAGYERMPDGRSWWRLIS